MNEFTTAFRYGYQHGRAAADIVMLSRMAPTPHNDPALFKPVKVRVVRPFYLAGKPLKVGEVATVEYHVARDMAAIRRAEIVA